MQLQIIKIKKVTQILKIKMYRAATIWLIGSITFFSCETNTENNKQEKAYPVEITLLKSTERTRQIEYFGTISSQFINYSFLTPGKVKSIFVTKNQFVKKGTKLMQLETKGFDLALNAVENQEIQAKNAYLEAERYYQNLKNVFKSGGVSSTDIEKAKLDSDIKLKEWELSKINTEAKKEDLKQATLIAKTDGIVSNIIPIAGELINAGAETIIMQVKGLFAETSISQKDLKYIKKGTKALVEIDNRKVGGAVSYISTLPDLQTFRHTVKINFTNSNTKATIGQTTKIYFKTDTVKGIWIPLKYIANNGQDFVNVAENNRLRKKIIQIIDFSGDEVRVSGLNENEKLITKGAAAIKEGYKVKIVN